MRFDEDHLVQETTANYLADPLGWESVLAWDNATLALVDEDGQIGLALLQPRLTLEKVAKSVSP